MRNSKMACAALCAFLAFTPVVAVANPVFAGTGDNPSYNAETIEMPDVIGLYDMYAAEELSKYLYDNAGICANIHFETWPNLKQDKNLSFLVADQYPQANTQLKKNEPVDITIYSYEGLKNQQRPCNANQIAMPDLSGLYDMYAA